MLNNFWVKADMLVANVFLRQKKGVGTGLLTMIEIDHMFLWLETVISDHYLDILAF